MTDEQLTRLPPKDFKYAGFRAAVAWGIEQGLVHLPNHSAEHMLRKSREFEITQNRQELMAKAQAIRLSKTKMDSSNYYRTEGQLTDTPTNEPEAQM